MRALERLKEIFKKNGAVYKIVPVVVKDETVYDCYKPELLDKNCLELKTSKTMTDGCKGIL